MMELRESVEVKVIEKNFISWKPAVIVGRTREEHPNYDARLIDGSIVSHVPEADVRKAA